MKKIKKPVDMHKIDTAFRMMHFTITGLIMTIILLGFSLIYIDRNSPEFVIATVSTVSSVLALAGSILYGIHIRRRYLQMVDSAKSEKPIPVNPEDTPPA